MILIKKRLRICRRISVRQIRSPFSTSCSREQERIHYYEMAGASAHYKQVENLVTAEIFMPAVEERELQCVNDTADCIYNSTGKKPVECGFWKCINNLCKCKNANPAHENIQY